MSETREATPFVPISLPENFVWPIKVENSKLRITSRKKTTKICVSDQQSHPNTSGKFRTLCKFSTRVKFLHFLFILSIILTTQ